MYPVIRRVLERQEVRQGQMLLPQKQMMRTHEAYLMFLPAHETIHYVHLPWRQRPRQKLGCHVAYVILKTPKVDKFSSRQIQI